MAGKTVRSKSELPSGCLALFGLPFFAGGLAMLSVSIYLLGYYFQTKTWKEVPARIQFLDLVKHRGSKGGTNYSIKAEYNFILDGKEKIGTRVLVDDSSGPYSEMDPLYRILLKHKNERTPISIFVDPTAPQHSVIFRRISTSMLIMPIIGFILCIVGGGIIVGDIYGWYCRRRRSSILNENPGRPWRAEEKWKDFSVQAETTTNLFIIWIVAIVFSTFVSVFMIALWVDSVVPIFVKLIIGLFALIALSILGWAIYLTLQYFKYGIPSLLLSQIPLVPGTEFSGVVFVKKRLAAEDGVSIKIRCIKSLTVGHGKQSKTITEDLFVKEQVVRVDLMRSGKDSSAVPFSFAIPGDLPERDSESNPRFSWKLNAQASTPGIDFETDFELPVYKVEDPSLIEKRVLS
ncbi:DUF3592 domain-containing protein [bacterium]|nr:DUF3592 domain-containing protein [bacterium]